MNKSSSKLFWLLLILLIAAGGWFFFKGSTTIITERTPWGLSVGTKIAQGKNYQNILSWDGEIPTLKEKFENILRQIENDQEQYEVLSAFLNEQSYSSKFLLHAMLFALEQKENSVFKTQFLTRHFSRLSEKQSLFGSEPIFLYLMGLKSLSKNDLKSASNLFSTAKELSPSFGKPYTKISKVYFQQCLYDSTLALLPYAITLDQSNRESSYSLLIKSLYHLEKRDSLNTALETLPQAFPYSKQLQLTVALAYENLDRVNKADAIYKNLLRLFPDDQEIKNLYSSIGENDFPSCSTPVSDTFSEKENLGLSVESLLSSHPKNPWLWVALWSSLKDTNPHRSEKIRLRILKQFPDLHAQLPTEDYQVTTDDNDMNISDDVPDSLASALRESLNSKKSLRSELGHYLSHWNSTKSKFFSSYNKSEFTNYGDTLFKQTDSLLGFPSTYSVLFRKQGLHRILGEFIDPNKRLDVLGRVLRAKSKLSGPPTNSGDMDCPGFKKFQFFIWEGGGQFELIAQFGSKTWQARMLRVSDKWAKDKQICDLADEILPIKVK